MLVTSLKVLAWRFLDLVYEVFLNTPIGMAKVAFKRLDQIEASIHYTMDDQFKSEVATIHKMSYVNLIIFKNYCMERSARLLVSEFIQRISLTT